MRPSHGCCIIRAEPPHAVLPPRSPAPAVVLCPCLCVQLFPRCAPACRYAPACGCAPACSRAPCAGPRDSAQTHAHTRTHTYARTRTHTHTHTHTHAHTQGDSAQRTAPPRKPPCAAAHKQTCAPATHLRSRPCDSGAQGGHGGRLDVEQLLPQRPAASWQM